MLNTYKTMNDVLLNENMALLREMHVFGGNKNDFQHCNTTICYLLSAVVSNCIDLNFLHPRLATKLSNLYKKIRVLSVGSTAQDWFLFVYLQVS